ncbi:hypothetical protein, partial [Pseudomonas helleri]|uniref:hypothetical protein n=1 Tax=Pseudomonas helleri TaxID=1608996 RepID=UPI001E4D4AA6
MFIESVVVSGPDLPDASVYFTKGANVVQGGSDTGKSYIVSCIKFALGATERRSQGASATPHVRCCHVYPIQPTEYR